MAKVLKRIKNSLAANALYALMPAFSRLSNTAWVRFTRLAEKSLSQEHQIILNCIRKIRSYCQENHPGLELMRRMLRDLNPRCKRRLLKDLIINAMFKNVAENQAYIDKYGFTPPWFMVLSPTMRCNLNCVGCSTRGYAKDSDLPIDVIDKLLIEAREMGIHFITTQGGEMFVYEEMMSLYKKHKDIYFQVYTNGTLIDKAMAKRLVKLGNVAPMISLEGFKETTDRRRGAGVFDKVMQAMDNLREVGCFFGASVTQTRNNSDEILSDEFFQMLVDKGCYVVWFFQFLPIGKDPDTSLMATPEQRLRLRSKIAEVRSRLPIFIGDFWNDGPLLGGCIAAGRVFLHINNRGDIEPCAFAHFSVDNIKNKTLREALQSDFFQFLRKRQPFGGGNLLCPCMIIDNPQVLREAVAKTGAKPSHEGAEVILSGKVKDDLDEYSWRMHELTAGEWEKIKDKVPKWPV